MLSTEFVSVYPLGLSDSQIYRGDYPDYIRDAQLRSYDLGRFVHATLSEQPPDRFTTGREITQYDEWLSGYPALERTMLRDSGLRPWNEINVHGLNHHMLRVWEPLFAGGWSSDEQRLSSIDYAQSGLALAGLSYYRDRERIKEMSGGTEDFFAPDSIDDYGRFTGIVQEYDAAIILMNVMRRNPNITIVPAPMQFERTVPRTNVDFLAIDFVDKNAVGIQVKTQVRGKHVETYDPERVVLVDGTVDLDQVKVIRIKRGTSKEAPRPWPGIIAAKRVEGIKTTGPRTHVAAKWASHLIQQKLLAKRLVGGIRLDYREVTNRISERIMDKLQ